MGRSADTAKHSMEGADGKSKMVERYLRKDFTGNDGFVFTTGTRTGYADGTDIAVDGVSVPPDRWLVEMLSGTVLRYRIGKKPWTTAEVSVEGVVEACAWLQENCPNRH